MPFYSMPFNYNVDEKKRSVRSWGHSSPVSVWIRSGYPSALPHLEDVHEVRWHVCMVPV